VTVKLRLMRMGKKKQPTYRIVAADSASPRDGRFIEIIGTYAPRSEPSLVLVDNAKVLRWLETGAQPTDRVRTLLAISGAWGEFESARTARAATRPAKQKPPRKRATGAPSANKAKPSAPAAKARAASVAAKTEDIEDADSTADETQAATTAKAATASKAAPASKAAKAAPAAKVSKAAKATPGDAKSDDGAVDDSEGES
jgi:small subunit ribosomal protein S16